MAGTTMATFRQRRSMTGQVVSHPHDDIHVMHGKQQQQEQNDKKNDNHNDRDNR